MLQLKQLMHIYKMWHYKPIAKILYLTCDCYNAICYYKNTKALYSFTC